MPIVYSNITDCLSYNKNIHNKNFSNFKPYTSMSTRSEYNINWKHYPSNVRIPNFLHDVVIIFENHYEEIATKDRKNALNSNDVLKIVSHDLEKYGFSVEKSKKKEDKISIPVLFKEQGQKDKCFDVDAWHPYFKIDVEVEAGRGFTNFQFLKDLFEACIMIDVDYLVIAIKNENYVKINGIDKKFTDYKNVIDYFNALYASSRMAIPLKGILIIGY